MTQEIIRSMADIQQMAETAFASGVMGISNSSQAVMKILAGREMGLGVFASLSNIHIINEKPVFSANLMAAMVKGSGRYDYQIQEFNDQICKLAFFEKRNGNWIVTGESSFTMDEAARADLIKPKGNWEKFPRNMLFARAMSNGVKWYCPDIFAGNTAYTPDEFDCPVDEEGEVVSGQWTEVSRLTVNDLIKEYGAAAVMEANGGMAPGDDDPDALAALKEKLETEYTGGL